MLLFVLVLVGQDAAAEQLMKLAPETRLMRGDLDEDKIVENVVVAAINPIQLPDSIQDDLKDKLLRCGGDSKQMESLLVYSWQSAWHREHKSSLSYLVDFSSLPPVVKQGVGVAVDGQKCLLGDVCTDEGCLLMGYSPVPGKVIWNQDFEVRSTHTQLVAVPASKTKNSLEIRILSNKKDCAQAKGIQTKKGCLRRFAWRKFGLSTIDPQ